LDLLIRGNARYIDDTKYVINTTSERRKMLTSSQTPFATIFSCVDSREPIEIIFNRGLGDLLITKTPGCCMSGLGIYGSIPNSSTVDNSIIATLEFGISGLSTPLVVVMGHTNCGAVSASQNWYSSNVIDPPAGPTTSQIQYFISGIGNSAKKAILATASANRAVQYQVEESLNIIRDSSVIVSTFMNDISKLTYGAIYDITTGVVQFAKYDTVSGTCNWSYLYP
jgi:carbonic anhydrase